MSLSFVGYTNKRTVMGNSGATARFTCPVGEWLTHRDALMRSVNGDDESLAVESVSFEYLNRDAASGIAELTANFIPVWKLDALIPDSEFKVRGEVSSLSFTVAPRDKDGNVRWRWASGEEILNDSVLPLCAQGVLRLVLFGTRSSVDASTWESYEDKVNSDTFLGRTAGKCIFKGASFSPRVLEDGTETNDIELHIETRNRSWNQFYNETTGEWEEIRRQDGGGNWTVTAFSAVAFSDLLEVPS